MRWHFDTCGTWSSSCLPSPTDVNIFLLIKTWNTIAVCFFPNVASPLNELNFMKGKVHILFCPVDRSKHYFSSSKSISYIFFVFCIVFWMSCLAWYLWPVGDLKVVFIPCSSRGKKRSLLMPPELLHKFLSCHTGFQITCINLGNGPVCFGV